MMAAVAKCKLVKSMIWKSGMAGHSNSWFDA